jgi:glycosyltransferase involved in cell wall biosynthesis
MKILNKKKIVAFGLRSFPPSEGSAGADKFCFELYTRLSKIGYEIEVYVRTPEKEIVQYNENIRVISIPTIKRKGYDTLIHSFIVTLRILSKSDAKIVHIQNGGNSVFAHILNLFGRVSFVSQDGIDWQRQKWSFLAKVYLKASSYLSSKLGRKLIIDNLDVLNLFEKKFNKKFTHIGFGTNVLRPSCENPLDVILNGRKYILFVGRFIPDKGVLTLIEAYIEADVDYILVLIGGNPNSKSKYDLEIKSYESDNVIIPGYFYGDQVDAIIRDASLYVQPSLVEGLSPVILQVFGIGTHIVFSNIDANLRIDNSPELTFEANSINSLREKIDYYCNGESIDQYSKSYEKARAGVIKKYSWDEVTLQHTKLFKEMI